VYALLGVNGAGYEATNASFVQGQTLPLLQDTAAVNVWGRWAVTYRDVVILNAENVKVGVYNLTEHDLSVESNRDALKALLRGAQR